MIGLLYILTAFFLMEGIAWFAHKHIMHRFLWSLHKDHHLKTHNSFWERNDFFFLIFALPGIFLIWKGLFHDISILLNVGIGIALYGLAYFVIHDIFIHQRFPILKKSNNSYLQALRKAHKVHHKHLSKDNGECFGMLLVPLKYYTAARKIKK